MPEKPQYKHNCDECVFLGHASGHDLYFCPKQMHVAMPTVIARWADEPSSCRSGLQLAEVDPDLAEARGRARARGLLP